MKKIIRIISGIILGTTPLIGFAMVGLAVYSFLPNIFGLIIWIIIELFALWLGFNIFKQVKILGPIAFLATLYASTDLDHHSPIKNKNK